MHLKCDKSVKSPVELLGANMALVPHRKKIPESLLEPIGKGISVLACSPCVCIDLLHKVAKLFHYCFVLALRSG